MPEILKESQTEHGKRFELETLITDYEKFLENPKISKEEREKVEADLKTFRARLENLGPLK